MRVEDFVQDGRYVLRAELPGIDPGKDLEMTVSRGILTIKAHRKEESQGRRRSEFRYGEFARGITRPDGADEDHIHACYDNGILEVTVALPGKGDKAGKQIPVRLSQHIKPTWR